uniref:NADH-ubiquinone oxidoreductase chain 3 n=1 Tax=Donax variegatus TaxID=1920007 RepID=A0A286NT53_9BIVA|nr:NADH dehydrogenase subunit 3 [Donax variegatus]ATA66412.1 NADH dehydrogenase subunit 3 [Donax variegatus]
MISVGGGVFYLFCLLIITLGLVAVGLVLGMKVMYNREKLSTYECGFEPLSSSRQAFCLRFFILAIIFVVFDVEIALLIPYVLSVGVGLSMWVRLLVLSFVVILLLGLVHEFHEGSLDWVL